MDSQAVEDLQEPDQQESEIPEDQISRASQDDNYQTASMRMSRMIHYSLATQLHSHSCQEVSEYPLSR